MERHEDFAFGAKEFVAAHPEFVDKVANHIAESPDEYPSDAVEKAKALKTRKKYEGLFTCPASDVNFPSAIRRLSIEELEAFKGELITRDLNEHCHKGRINAVAKEIRRRGSASAEIVAVDNMAEDIVTADNQYGDGMPYDLDRMENEIRFYQDQAGQSLLEMGKRLIRIKAHEGHGKFLESLNRLGMTPRSSQYAMLAAKKFSNTQTSAYLGNEKIRALTVLDEDDIKTLESGGSVAGMTLDDIDRMTIRELRGNLRKEKEKVRKEKEARKRDRDAQEDAITQRDAKINELEQQLRYQEPPTKEQIAGAALGGMTRDYTYALAEVNNALRKVYSLLTKAEKIENVNVQQLSDWLGIFDGEMRTFGELREAWENEIENAGPIADWRFSDLPGGEEA
jgi:hypothetical protein